MTTDKNEQMEQLLGDLHDQVMDLLDAADTEVMWVEGPRGILIFAKDTTDPEQVNFIKPLKAALGMNVDGETVQ